MNSKIICKFCDDKIMWVFLVCVQLVRCFDWKSLKWSVAHCFSLHLSCWFVSFSICKSAVVWFITSLFETPKRFEVFISDIHDISYPWTKETNKLTRTSTFFFVPFPFLSVFPCPLLSYIAWFPIPWPWYLNSPQLFEKLFQISTTDPQTADGDVGYCRLKKKCSGRSTIKIRIAYVSCSAKIWQLFYKSQTFF